MNCNCQEPYNLKEQFDNFRYTDHVFGTYTGYLPFDIELENQLSDGMSFGLESYLTMFETTQDKAYLYRFINKTVQIQNMRGYFPATNGSYYGPYSWAYEPAFYHNGLLLWPMAHFVHLVLVDQPSLQAIPLNTSCLNAPTTLTTFGDFAIWLRSRIAESLDDFITHHWASTSKAFVEKPDIFDNASMEINKEAPFASTLFYIGHTYSSPNSYLTKAAQMAELYKGAIDFTDHCSLGPPICSPINYQYPLLRENTTINSYWWFSEGWRVSYRPCGALAAVCSSVNDQL